MRAILLLTTLFVLTANANVPFVGALKIKSKSTKNMRCPNFNGKWEGICTHKDSNSSATVQSNIEIDLLTCNEILINKTYYPIGGMKVETDTLENRSSSTTSILEWNNKANPEFIKFIVNMNSISYHFDEKNKWNGTGTMKIQNSKLYVNQKNDEGLEIDCEYTEK